MFDLGFWELLLISIIALIVVGPDKIPELAQSIGKFIGKIKRFVWDTQTNIQQELGTHNLKEQFGFNEDESILEIVKDTKEQIQEQFDTNTTKQTTTQSNSTPKVVTHNTQPQQTK